MLLPGRHANTSDYRYGFQGQELDNEIKGEGNSLNYKFRMHDPRVGRFFAVDPLAHKYSYNSPYAFSENSVIAYVELEGLEKEFYFDKMFIDPMIDSYTPLTPEQREANKESLITFGKGFGLGLTDIINPVEWAKGIYGMAELGLMNDGERAMVLAQSFQYVKQIHQNQDDAEVGRLYGNVVGGFFSARFLPKLTVLFLIRHCAQQQ